MVKCFIFEGRDAAEKFASEHGLHILGEVIDGSNDFHVRHSSRKVRSSKRSNFVRNWSKKGQKLSRRLAKRSVQEPHQIEKRILSHSDVSWAERQTVKPRAKRDYGLFHGTVLAHGVKVDKFLLSDV